MTADVLLSNGRIHPLAEPDGGADPTASALAIRDGRLVAIGDEARRLAGSDTTTIDVGGGTVLPGFIDAHTHLVHEGMTLVHADLSTATSREDARDRLIDHADSCDPDDPWIVGVGYDESTWPAGEQPTRADLDGVSTDRPVAAVRVDMHTAALNSVALDQFAGQIADEHVRTRQGEPTGIIVEDALDVIEPVFSPSRATTRELITRAIERATRLGITGVHDKVGVGHAPRVYRELDRDGDLDIRVRLDYWRDYLEALVEAGLTTNHGSELVTVGAVKTFTDGSIGGRTARVSAPYADEPADNCGQWVVAPETFRALVDRAAGEGFQLSVHAIGDAAIDLAVAELAAAPGDRHRIEHAELASDEAIERMAEAGIVASMQPNFHRWAGEDGLYETALGPDRTRRTNRLRTMVDAGVPLAFGSDCMPMDPLLGIHHAVNAPTDEQALPVTAALRAYTSGSAVAGFDDHRLGTLETGKRADLVVLEESPWDRPDAIDAIDVTLTVVDGRIVYDAR